MYLNGHITAKNNKEGKTMLIVEVPEISGLSRFAVNGVIPIEIRIDDGRTISNEQRKKVYATIRDISKFTGHMPEFLKEFLKYEFMAETGEKHFSLRDCSVTTAKDYIDYLIEFAFKFGIATDESLLSRTENTSKYLWLCIKYKKCAITNLDGEVHHVDVIGMGGNRKKVDDSKSKKICLSREYHTEAHTIGWESFKKKYHVYGIVYDEVKE